MKDIRTIIGLFLAGWVVCVAVTAAEYTGTEKSNIGNLKISFVFDSKSGMLEMFIKDKEGKAVTIGEKKVTVNVRRKKRAAVMTAVLLSDPLDGDTDGTSHFKDTHKFLQRFDSFTVFIKIRINGRPCYSEWTFTKHDK